MRLQIESNIPALVLLNLLNSLRKKDKMLGKPHILSFFPTRLINSIKHEHSCKILYFGDSSNLMNEAGYKNHRKRSTKF